MNFAGMGQFRNLWQPPFDRNPPVLFCFTNNFYAMGGQTRGETMAWDRLSRIGAGMSPAQLHAETVDGSNPLAVADAVARKAEVLRAGEGPALLDIECYRYSGHSTTDTNAYRSRDEMKAWQAHDPITRFRDRLVRWRRDRRRRGRRDGRGGWRADRGSDKVVVNRQLAPAVDLEASPTIIGDMTFNNEVIELVGGRGPAGGTSRDWRGEIDYAQGAFRIARTAASCRRCAR